VIIDTHCHLHDPVFGDLRGTLARGLARDVQGIIVVGCDPATNLKTLEVAGRHSKVIRPCLRCHPEWTHLSDADVEEVERQVVKYHALVVALGEVGLPWYALETAADPASLIVRGQERLHRFLEVAARYDLPVVFHAPHGAAADALVLLDRHEIELAVLHWHKAPAAVTRQIVDAGYLVSMTPELVTGSGTGRCWSGSRSHPCWWKAIALGRIGGSSKGFLPSPGWYHGSSTKSPA
jgi:TatD DNase family protein